MTKKILFLVPYPLDSAPSQRFRFEQYFPVLHKHGYTFRVQSFLKTADWKLFFTRGTIVRKSILLVSGYVRRSFVLLTAWKYNFIFIHREAAPLGPPAIEWILAALFRKKIIYDFDDAIWLTDRGSEPYFLKTLKWRSKVSAICAMAYKISCGNKYLCSFASKYNERTVCVPSTVDLQQYHQRDLPTAAQSAKKRLTIGWTGSHSTLKYLREVEPALAAVLKKYPEVEFVVIADRRPELNFNFRFIEWRKESEIADLSTFDIGIMPLPDDPWTRGKCGFKALQYLSLKIPAVVSDVGVNKEIISDGVEGFTAATHNEWIQSLGRLITDGQLRRNAGEAGRRKVDEHYSVTSNASRFLSLFE